MRTGKQLVVEQGYIPSTCTLPDELAFALVMSEEEAGRRACWGCNDDRRVCKGEPKWAEPEPPDLPPPHKEPPYQGKPNRKRRRRYW